MNWTEEADGLLVKLWEEGRTLSEVAAGMRAAGYSQVNKNMVAGRKHVLRSKGVAISHREPPIQPKRNVKSRDPAVKPTVVNGKGVDYLANRDGCKALLDTRGSYGLPMCCGRTKVNGKPYCEAHLQLYHPPSVRK